MTDNDLNMSIIRLSETIAELSKNIQELIQNTNQEDTKKLKEFEKKGTLLEFTLSNGGVIVGNILWSTNQSIGIITDTGQEFILYKHSISFITEKK
ncbi:MAG: Hfq-like protein [bacterium]